VKAGALNNGLSLNRGLDGGDVNGRKTLVGLFEFKLDFVAFAQRLETVGLDLGVMNEDVLSEFLFNEAKTFVVIEPLNSTGIHYGYLLETKDDSWLDSNRN
jgi:hypothetical protein